MSKTLKGSFVITVDDSVTEDQVNEAVRSALHQFKVPETVEEVYVGGSDDQPPH